MARGRGFTDDAQLFSISPHSPMKLHRLSRRPLALLLSAAFPTLSAFPAAAEEILRADSVVVTATRTEQSSFDLPVSIDMVSSDIIHDAQPQINLTETSVRIPGVVVNNRFNASQDLAISTRGFGARSAFGVRGVRLYSDGIPLSMPDGQGQTGTFNLDTARSIEFMRGPFSALYGNSSGGVVQIFTKNGIHDPTLSAGVAFGSYNTRRESVTLEGQSENLNYIINASDLSSDGYRDHSKTTREMQHAKLSYTPSATTRLTLVATALNQDGTEDPLGLTETQYRQNPQQAGTNAIARNTRINRSHTQAGLVLDQIISTQDSVSVMGYYGLRDNQQFQTLGATGRVSSIDRKFGGLDAKWTRKSELAGRPFMLVAGINYDTMEDARTQNNAANGVLIPGVTRDELQKVHNFDQYIQATFEPTERWLLVAGLRHTNIKFDITDKIPTPADGSGALKFSNTSPVLGATFRLTPTVNLYANYGRGFETPTFIELTYSGDPSNGTGPNLTLQPSKSKNYELGIKAFATDNTRINFALFKVDTEKEIVTDQGNGATASFKNAGATGRTGIEFSLDSALPNNFNLYAAFTRMKAEFKDSFCTGSPCTTVQAGNEIPGTYTSTGYAELSWKHPVSGFSAALEGIRFSDTYVMDTNAQKANGYTLFNVRASFTQNVGGWKLKEYLRIENLADKTYVSSVRVNASSNPATGAFFEPGAPRNWLAGISAAYRF